MLTKLQKYPPLLLIYSLGFVFLVFGILKVFNISPVRDFVVATTPLFTNEWLFRGLGVLEVGLGIGLIFRLSRKWAALGIVFHLGGIFLISLLNPQLIFSSETIITFTGEFVLKNLVLIAVALNIAINEEGKKTAK